MMYNQKLIICIKSNGQILREFKDTAYIKFGSEYSILIKNIHTRRACVNITIDGKSAVEGGLIINPNSEVDLQRWVTNGNLTEGNAFKFIERTSNIEKHRGIKLEDGLIRIEFQYEVDWNRILKRENSFYRHDPVYHYDYIKYSGNINTPLQGAGNVSYSSNNAIMGQASVNSVMNVARSYNDAGITVPGSHVEQKFQQVSNFCPEPEKHVMVIKLLGETPDNKLVMEPITVKTKQKCDYCGKMNKATAKFCQECGAALVMYA